MLYVDFCVCISALVKSGGMGLGFARVAVGAVRDCIIKGSWSIFQTVLNLG